MSWLREPLWIFLLLGVGLFWLDGIGRDRDREIDVRLADIDRLKAQWQTQTGRAPSESELAGLIDQFIEEEVYFREAKRLSLDHNDTIIRRRLVQKLTFLTEDRATAAQPSDDELAAYFEDNREKYRVPETFSFRHVYFSRDRRANPVQDAEDALAAATARESDPVGDPFMLQSSFVDRSERDIAGTFGRDFAAALPGVRPLRWSQPVASAYGQHLVYISGRADSYVPELEAIKARVANDLLSDRRSAANAAYRDELLAKYRIKRP
ncbi:MAG: peptidyl-prolyl cis-trans isomerase [Pseudomonadota bacterium]